ncbi:hypothetical protein SAMN04487972_101158 [Paracoccus halophilus]|uniref:Uncharacterized protein n=1 Tax=Paracoccus halophilus TaxID=376733 RepID=A0A099F6Q9_9RHOB|nr:DUF6477 family protein [Paracoccus halophilus]KGJ06400.1 hypothetical protein IT41_01810 [Paracoccus halophilus]SFA38609.1 hypothetical protein SAMN04487972_101158 [Paracoccus halophilus]
MSNVIAFEPRPSQPRLRRPGLLVRAARAGLAGWNRRRDLHRVLKCEQLPPAGAILPRLHAEEARLDAARRAGQAEYDLHRHIMLLIAILAETAEAAPRPVAGAPRAAICL